MCLQPAEAEVAIFNPALNFGHVPTLARDPGPLKEARRQAIVAAQRYSQAA